MRLGAEGRGCAGARARRGAGARATGRHAGRQARAQALGRWAQGARAARRARRVGERWHRRKRAALGVRRALGHTATSSRARGARVVAGAWAFGELAAQAWARLCTPGCAQLGQVGCFVHSDSVFDPV